MTPPLPAPTDLPSAVETERLLLRPWETADAAALHAALVESVDHLNPWVPWASPHAPTMERARDLLAGWMQDLRTGDSYILAVLDRAGGGLIGGVGLYPRVGPGGLEIGYWIRRSRTGRGFATEASAALTHVGFRVAGASRIEMHIHRANRASFRISEKLGYVPRDVATTEEADSTQIAVLVLRRDEHDAASEPAAMRWAREC